MYSGWRRAELAHWLKWVPVMEQLEIFRPEDSPGIDTRDDLRYLDIGISVSAAEAEARVA